MGFSNFYWRIWLGSMSSTDEQILAIYRSYQRCCSFTLKLYCVASGLANEVQCQCFCPCNYFVNVFIHTKSLNIWCAENFIFKTSAWKTVVDYTSIVSVWQIDNLTIATSILSQNGSYIVKFLPQVCVIITF